MKYVLAVVFVCGLVACNQNPKPNRKSINRTPPTSAAPIPEPNKPTSVATSEPDSNADVTKNNPSAFFPTETGTEWIYRVDLKEVDPLTYNEVAWPQGEKSLVMATRGRIMPFSKEAKGKKVFTLDYKIKGKAEKQGELQYPIGAELQIVKDDLEVFRDVKNVFFAASPSGGFMALLVATYSPDSSGAPRDSWGGWNQKNGFAKQIFFFAREPGTGISNGDSPDTLVFMGSEKKEALGENLVCLHFHRIVEGSKKEKGDEAASILDKPFTEDTWFALGKGLILLEQKVDKKPSMTWTLTEFKKGKDK